MHPSSRPDPARPDMPRRRRRQRRASVLTGATVGLAALGGVALGSSFDGGRRPTGPIGPAIEGRIEAAPVPVGATVTNAHASEPTSAVTVAGAATPVAAPAPVEADRPEVVRTWETVASWYGPGFAGNLTANGETFDPDELTAAHRELPFDSWVRVTAVATGRSVVVRINDRGPYIDGRGIDLSRAAAESIGLRGRGVGRVVLELLAEPPR